MGACASSSRDGQARHKKGDPQSRSGEGKVFSLSVHAGLKAAAAHRRQAPESPPISARARFAKQPVSALKQPRVPQPACSDPADSCDGPLAAGGTRARRLSFTGPCGEAAASPGLPAAPPSASSGSLSSASRDCSTPLRRPADTEQHAAQPTPERRVRFSDSPEKTRGWHEDEGETASTGPQPARAPPFSSSASAPSPSPARAAAAAFAAAEARIRGGIAAAVAASPTKAAAVAAVPMAELIHSVASLSRAGREPTYRKQNQDNCFCYREYCRPNQALLATLDGHGPNGHLVSDFLRAQLPLILAEELGEKGGGRGSGGSSSSFRGGGGAPPDAAAALAAAFPRADDALAAAGVNVAYSGSTAVLCMLQGRRLTTAWVGDSRAVLARQEPRGCRAVCLTRDHKPSTPDERARIQSCGGRVERLVDQRGQPVGPQRVWLADSWVPGLAMSRALGDAVAHSVGVCSEPETTVVELCPQDRWLLLATDGVWEFLDPQTAVDIVAECRDAEEACRLLVESAWSKWLVEEEGVVDDITVVAVRLNP